VAVKKKSAKIKAVKKHKKVRRIETSVVAKVLGNIHTAIIRLENKLDGLKRENAPVSVQTAAEGDQ
jgi:hypothetical protein